MAEGVTLLLTTDFTRRSPVPVLQRDVPAYATAPARQILNTGRWPVGADRINALVEVFSDDITYILNKITVIPQSTDHDVGTRPPR